jgi:hypothetical protein
MILTVSIWLIIILYPQQYLQREQIESVSIVDRCNIKLKALNCVFAILLIKVSAQ